MSANDRTRRAARLGMPHPMTSALREARATPGPLYSSTAARRCTARTTRRSARPKARCSATRRADRPTRSTSSSRCSASCSKEQSPSYIAASFDLPGRTFRDDLAADYKANRAPMPDDLAEQIPLVHRACEALGVPILTAERYEADDVIGTLAARPPAAGLRRRDRHGRQGLLPARARRRPRVQPARRRHVVRRGGREGEVRRRAGPGRRRRWR